MDAHVLRAVENLRLVQSWTVYNSYQNYNDPERTGKTNAKSICFTSDTHQEALEGKKISNEKGKNT